MAGAADRGRAWVVARTPAPERLARLRTHALALRPSRVALGLSLAALAGHATLWQSTAPWGRAPVAGALLTTAGLVWVVWAWALYRSVGTPVGATDTPLQLIEEGPYRYGRNPMYLGTSALLLGAALGLGVPLLAASAMLLVALLNAVHIPHEEATLLKRFGGWYRDYAGTTRRWF